MDFSSTPVYLDTPDRDAPTLLAPGVNPIPGDIITLGDRSYVVEGRRWVANAPQDGVHDPLQVRLEVTTDQVPPEGS